MDANTPNGTGNTTLSYDEGVDKLAGILADSKATPDNLEVETEEVEAAPVEENEAEEMDAEVTDPEYDGDDEETYEAAEEAEEQPEDIAVEINGEVIPLEEVQRSYERQADYTRKTQDLASQRKELEAERESINAEREHLKRMLEMQATTEQSDERTPEQWEQFADEDPLGYITARAKFDAKQQAAQASQAERQRLSQVEMQQQQQKMAEHVQKEQAKLVEAIPELKGENASQYKANILTYMQGSGYSKDEAASLLDHRAVVVLDKARKYDELQSKKGVVAKKVKGKPRVIRPGVKKSAKASTQAANKKARSKLRKSGSVDDAVNFLLS